MPKGKRGTTSRGPRPAHQAATAKAVATVPLMARLRPWILGAVTALVVCRPLFPSEAPPENGDNLPVVMLWLVLTALWLLVASRSGEFRLRLGAVDVAIGLLVGWHTIASLWAATHGSPRAAINLLWLWIAYGTSFFLARQVIGSRREARAIVVVLLGLAVGLAAFGLEQYFYEIPKTRDTYLQDRDAWLRAAGLWSPPGSPQRDTFEKRLFAVEPSATFALNNSLAGFLAPWLAMCAGVALCGWQCRQRWRITLAAVSLVTLMAASLLLTKSRSGDVAALVGMPLAWWACRRRDWRLNWKLIVAVVAGIAVLVALAANVGGLNKEVASEATKSLSYRLQYWQATLRMVADYPIFGCGPGQFQDTYTAYKLPESSEEIADPHNFALELWATAGPPALLALLAALGLFAWVVAKGRSQQSKSNPTDGATVAAGSAETPPPLALPEVAAGIDASTYVVGGGAAGFLLAIPLGLMSSAPPSLNSQWIGLPLAALVVAGLWPWVREGTLPAALPGVGVVVLLINLLAAGALGFAGLAGSMWLLMAVGLNLAERAEPRSVGHKVRWGMLGATLAVCLTCYLTAYAPWIARQAAMQQAEGQPARAIELLERATDADRWAVEPRTQLAATSFAQWQQHPTPESLRQFQRYQQAVLALAPHSNTAWAEAAERYWAVFQRTKDQNFRQQAIEAFQKAVDRYPTSASHRASLALAFYAAGEFAAAQREAREATRLHAITPHEDKKLPPSVLGELNRVLDELNRGVLRNTSGLDGPRAKAP